MPDASISIVIPVLNEVEGLPSTIEACRDPNVSEIIVCDGHSEDGSPETARRLGARVVQTDRGRARQMNQGASVASGKYLLFVHGDTTLPSGFGTEVIRILSQPRIVAGAFRLRIDAAGVGYRLVEIMVNWRSRLLNLPYGDQGLFLRAETFRRFNGFPPLPILEDFEFVRRLGRHGQIGLASQSVLTSARRWQQSGILKMTLLNQAAVWSYLSGIEPEHIARWYRRRSRIR